MTTLSPAQQHAYEALRGARDCGHVFVLDGRTGCGRSTVARRLAGEFGAGWIDAGQLFATMKQAHPLHIEEEWCGAILAALREKSVLVVDDFDCAQFLAGGCHLYPRTGYLETGLTAICDEADRRGAWVLFVGGHSETLGERALHYSIPKFTVADQAFFVKASFSAEACRSLDYEKIFRFAPMLSARQIARASRFLTAGELTTEEFIDYLRRQDLVTNVDLGQVEEVDLRDLHGVDDVLARLESNIVLPLENDELSKRFKLTPRRGVLLYGPPGTGKTTVGRALARRLKSKFFLIDGTFICGTNDFYSGVIRVFEMAKRNAPAVVFVDDSDVIFEQGEEMGFYRYLLTILDGIESEEAGRLTVMLTAMNIAHLPPALIRSGRVELWLEMKPPDAGARRRILDQRMLKSAPSELSLDLDVLARETDGFTGADLRRLIEDGKNLCAYEIAQGRPANADANFLRALHDIKESKRLLGAAEVEASAHFPSARGRNLPFAAIQAMMRHARGDGG
jgi:ATP-dependent 26S proteasome regulatory subunit